MASSSLASSKLAMPRARRKHRSASLCNASASPGGSAPSEDRQRVSNGKICYTDAMTTAGDGTPVLDLTRIGALEPDVGDRQEQGWTEREEAPA
jgi:hypothetical protein